MDYTGELLPDGEGTPIIEANEQQSGMRSVQNLEAIINEGLRVALLEETPDQSLKVLLEHLGKALNGERTYIFEQNESGSDDNTYEWVADGVEPEQENLQNVPPEVCASWYRKFSVGRHIVIENVEDIRESEPLQYENLKRQDIQSLVVVPLYDGKRIIGFYGVDNPPKAFLDHISGAIWRGDRAWRAFWREPEPESGLLSWRRAASPGCTRIGPCGFSWVYRMASGRRSVTGTGLSALNRTMWRWSGRRCRRC